MNLLQRKLYEANIKKARAKPSRYNGFTFREIAEFENAIIEVHSLCTKKFEETQEMHYATVALDCLKAINDMEKIKTQISMKG
ncbi:MAG: hypothetical protein ACTSQI_16860 [Candidatus Helarchaeota archaeon]